MQNIGGGAKYIMAPQPNYWRGHGPPGPPYRAPHVWAKLPEIKLDDDDDVKSDQRPKPKIVVIDYTKVKQINQ